MTSLLVIQIELAQFAERICFANEEIFFLSIIYMSDHINFHKMVYNSLWDNKILGLSIVSLFTGYWFQDIVFSRNFSKIIADIPNFSQNITASSVFEILFPYLIASFLFYIDDIISAYVFPKAELELAHNLLDQIFESIKTSKIDVNVNELMLNLKSVFEVKNIYILSVVYILPTVIIGFGLLYYFFKHDTKSGLIIICVMIFFLILNMISEKECIKISNDHDKEMGVLYEKIQDIMVNNDVILTNNTKTKEFKNIKKQEDICCQKHKKSEIVSCEVTFGLGSLGMLFMLIVDGVAIKMYKDNKISSDLLITICMMSYTFMQYYNSAVFKFKSVMHCVSRYKELNEYFAKFKLEKQTNINIDKIKNGTMEFKDVQIIHDNNEIQPQILNFTIKGRDKTGIIGEVGTGKTSIIKILAGLKKYKGTVLIDSKNLKDLSYETITQHITYIPQHPKLFNRTIYENLSYNTNYSKKKLKQILEDMKLTEFFAKFKNGLDTEVGKEGKNLSGGQRQILALIRAMIHQKPILLLDEPTAALDTKTKDLFINLLDKIKGKTVIIISHDKTIFNLFDKIIEIAN